jgi:hypothetical protein
LVNLDASAISRSDLVGSSGRPWATCRYAHVFTSVVGCRRRRLANHIGERRDRDASAAVTDRPLQRSAPRTRLSAMVHSVSSSQLTEDPDCVRSFGGYKKVNRSALTACQSAPSTPDHWAKNASLSTGCLTQTRNMNPIGRSKAVKADNKTVASRRRRSEGREEIPHVATRTDRSKGDCCLAPCRSEGREEIPHVATRSDRSEGALRLCAGNQRDAFLRLLLV